MGTELIDVCSLSGRYHSANVLVSTAGVNLAGSDLYSKLLTYYIEHLKPIIAVGIIL